MAAANSFRLFDLPQELQDIIFDLAYPDEPYADFTNPESWEYEEKEKRKQKGPSYTKRPYPNPKVNEWLVSKQYFVAAAKAWVQNQSLDDGDSRTMLGFGDHPGGVLAQWLTRSNSYWDLGKMPSVKCLNIAVHHSEFEGLEDYYPWECELDEEAFMKTRIYQYLKDVRGLQSFKAEAMTIYIAEDNEKATAIWTSNVHAFGAFMERLVTRPEDEGAESVSDDDLDGPTPLYNESLVFFDAPMARIESKAERKSRPNVLDYGDIPKDPGGFKELMAANEQGVMDWIVRMKRLESMILKCYGKKSLR